MYGTLEYDGDGNLVARLKLYPDHVTDRDQPELARVTVAEQVTLLEQNGGPDAIFETLEDGDQREVVKAITAILSNRINGNSFVKAYVNHSNGHQDLWTAVRLAVEPGGAQAGGPTFRVTV